MSKDKEHIQKLILQLITEHLKSQKVKNAMN